MANAVTEQALLIEQLQKRSLNELMDSVEADLGRLEIGSTEKALSVLLTMDAVFSRLKQLEVQGLPLKAEKVQYEYVTRRIQADAGRILRALGGGERLAALREPYRPDEERWWWYLGDVVKRSQVVSLRRYLTLGGIIVAVLLMLVLIYQNFLAPDPLVTQIYGLKNSAGGHMMAGDFNAALADVEQGLAVQPAEPELLLLKGAILTRLERNAEADQTWQAAQQAIGDRELFLLSRSATWLQLGDADRSQADAQAVLDANPESAEGMFYLARGYELKGNFEAAVSTYEKASELASQQGKAQLTATIRVNMAMLMQSLPQMPTGEATEAH